MTFGERVKAIRKDAGLSQTEFGQRIGLTVGAICDIQRGRTESSQPTRRAICAEFNVNPLWLDEQKEPMYVPPPEDDIDALIDRMTTGTETAKAFIRWAATLPEEQIKAITEAARTLLDKINADEKSPDA